MNEKIQAIIDANNAFIKEHNLKSWEEIHAKVLELRLSNKGEK